VHNPKPVFMKSKIHLAISLLNLAVVIFFASYYFLSEREQIVYVDSNQLLNGYQGMIEARKAYQQKTATWKANIDTLVSEVQQQIFKYEKESPRMTPKERSLSQELIRAKQKQLTDYQQAMNSQAQQEDSKMTSDVLAQVNVYLKKYGESKGYRIILAATDYGNLAYAEAELNITNEVLTGLNDEYAGR
jgi:outer membrane protein